MKESDYFFTNWQVIVFGSSFMLSVAAMAWASAWRSVKRAQEETFRQSQLARMGPHDHKYRCDVCYEAMPPRRTDPPTCDDCGVHVSRHKFKDGRYCDQCKRAQWLSS